jgi:hypothetical protein
VTALLLSAVSSTRVHTSIALSANELVDVVFTGQNLKRRLDDTTSQTQNQVQSGFLLDVVVRQSATIFQLFAGKDQSLLIWGNAFLVLDLLLNLLDGVARLDLEGDSLAGQGLNEDLHTTTETEHQVESRFLLDVVVGQSATIFELLASENQSLLIWGNAFLVLDLLLDLLDGIRRFNFESDGLASEGLDEDLHTTTQAQNQVESGLLLDVVVGKSTAVLELLSGEDETLLIWGNTFLVLNLLLDLFNGVGGLDFQGDGLSGQSLDEDLHTTAQSENQVEGGFLLNVVVGKSTAVFQLLSGEDKSLLIWRDSFLVLNFFASRSQWYQSSLLQE